MNSNRKTQTKTEKITNTPGLDLFCELTGESPDEVQKNAKASIRGLCNLGATFKNIIEQKLSTDENERKKAQEALERIKQTCRSHGLTIPTHHKNDTTHENQTNQDDTCTHTHENKKTQEPDSQEQNTHQEQHNTKSENEARNNQDASQNDQSNNEKDPKIVFQNKLQAILENAVGKLEHIAKDVLPKDALQELEKKFKEKEK